MSIKLEEHLPVVKFNGLNTDKAVVLGSTLTVSGATTISGAVSGLKPVEATTGETEAITAAESGKTFVQTRSSTTVTYTLPAAAAGLTYTFVCGHADSEILITPATGDAIVTKIHAAQD